MSSPPKPPISYRLARSMRKAGERIAGAWQTLVWPIERGIGWLFGRSLSATESFENVEGLLLGLMRLLLLPFRLLSKLLGWLAPAAVRELVADAYHNFWETLYGAGGRLWRLAEWLNLDAVLLWVAWLAWPVWRPIAGLLGFVHAWLVTRETRQLLWGLPAVVLLLPFAAIGYQAYSGGATASVPAYRLALEAATDANDFEQVQLLERKLSQLGVSTQLNTFNRGEVLAAQGDWAGAYTLMQRLAPTDQAGYPRAHYWIVQQLLAGKLDDAIAVANAPNAPANPAETREQLVEQHLAHLESLGIRSPGIVMIRASKLLEANRVAEAADLLRPLARDIPQAAFEVLRLDIAASNDAALRLDAELVVNHLQALEQSGQPFSANLHAMRVVALGVLGRTDDVEQVYTAWLEDDPQSDEARRGLRQALQSRFASLVGASSSNPSELADLLVRIAKLAPPKQWLLRQIEQLYAVRENAVIATQIPDRTMEQVLKRDDAPADLLSVLGIASAGVNELPRALTAFHRVTQVAPNEATGWNNYAWVLSQGQPEGEPSGEASLDQALAAVEKALALSPGEHRFRETRGQIFVKLGNWQRAIEDLEFAINGMPEQAEIHASLADAYQAVGDTELAQLHRNQAE